MTNLHRSKKNKGAATLVISLMLLIISTLIILFAAKNGIMQDKLGANITRNNQAFLAAEGGLEYGFNYLKQNSATIIATAASGHINYTNASITNVTFGNSSKFTITYTNPTANDYTVIQITSVGTNDDGTGSRTISQLAKQGSLITNPGNTAIVSKGNVSMSGNGEVNNFSTSKSIASAGTVSFSGNAETNVASGGGSDSGHIGSDVIQNSSTLQNQSASDFFASIFGNSNYAAISGSFANYYSNSSNTNYSGTLNGKTGTTIWIDATNNSTASLSGNTTIGSAANPVLLVVNGSLSISGNVTIYGFVFVVGTSGLTTLTGNNNINGALATSDNLNISGNTNVNYSSAILNALKTGSATVYWAKIAGSWKDY